MTEAGLALATLDPEDLRYVFLIQHVRKSVCVGVAVGSEQPEKIGKEEEKCSRSQMCGAWEGERGLNTRTEPGHSPPGAWDPSLNHSDGPSTISLKLQLLFSFLPLAAIFGCTCAQCGASPGQVLTSPSSPFAG